MIRKKVHPRPSASFFFLTDKQFTETIVKPKTEKAKIITVQRKGYKNIHVSHVFKTRNLKRYTTLVLIQISCFEIWILFSQVIVYGALYSKNVVLFPMKHLQTIYGLPKFAFLP